ncbi:At2g23090 like protein [Cercophora newfieldiana]|uniref:At2g23090 like protein n=1 Tax=Cercophora newfieldiana TaxID=92897 RepID=A0AA39YS17_9PEZI|nr:At2g23090 like protein [Cercophora newfieldiana]
MGGGNGAKAAQKRERNAKNGGGAAKSQLKVNAKAMNIQCDTCKATFLSTTRENALTEHAVNKHNKTLVQCFPGFQAAAAAK